MTNRLDQDANGTQFTSKRRGLTAAALTAATLAVCATGAYGAPVATPEIEETPVFQRDVLTQKDNRLDEKRRDYDRLFEQAKRLDVEPKRNTADEVARDYVLDAKLATLRKDVRKETKPEYGTPESVGVAQSTLDAIAACESGGNPAAVDPSGTYRGKYQFDLGTWASVGGSGDPAAAPEAEQDYRAAVLLSQSGSSPWPVCG